MAKWILIPKHGVLTATFDNALLVKHGHVKGARSLLKEERISHKTAHFPTAANFAHPQSHPLFWPNHSESFHHPLVPDLSIICLSPNTDFELRIIGVINGIL